MHVREFHPTTFTAQQSKSISTTAMQLAQKLELRETPTSTVVLPIVCRLDAGVSCSFPDTEDPPCWSADPLALIGCY